MLNSTTFLRKHIFFQHKYLTMSIPPISDIAAGVASSAAAAAGNAIASAKNAISGLTGSKPVSSLGPASSAQSQTEAGKTDWRVRMALAPDAKYLYKDPAVAASKTHLLYPLFATGGVVFPYTPAISLSYNATYDPQELTHTNFKMHQYRSSEVGAISIAADFTAQDEYEAKYILAMIFFFKSATKMFYGQDTNAGLPPPLCYLSGYGNMQFNNHPLAITSFAFQLPQDVDYIRVVEDYGKSTTGFTTSSTLLDRASSAKLILGAGFPAPKFTRSPSPTDTYVPTKLSISLQCVPIISRQDMANNFSLEKYASGALNGPQNGRSGGIW